jgi:hypothetical protein
MPWDHLNLEIALLVREEVFICRSMRRQIKQKKHKDIASIFDAFKPSFLELPHFCKIQKGSGHSSKAPVF